MAKRKKSYYKKKSYTTAIKNLRIARLRKLQRDNERSNNWHNLVYDGQNDTDSVTVKTWTRTIVMEGLDYGEEGVTEVKYSTRPISEEVITDDIPTEESLAPFPVKLVKVSTGEEVQYAEEREISVKDASDIKREIPDIQEEMETIKVESSQYTHLDTPSIVKTEMVEIKEEIEDEWHSSENVACSPEFDNVSFDDDDDTKAEITDIKDEIEITENPVSVMGPVVEHMHPAFITERTSIGCEGEASSSSRLSSEGLTVPGKVGCCRVEEIESTDVNKSRQKIQHSPPESDESSNWEEIIFPCRTCAKKFKTKKGLKVHEKLHNKDLCVLCAVCNKPFTSKSQLAEHIVVHSGLKPYQCDICKSSFTQLGSLKRHQEVHTVQQLTCETCSKTYSTKSGLRRHQKIHSNRS